MTKRKHIPNPARRLTSTAVLYLRGEVCDYFGVDDIPFKSGKTSAFVTKVRHTLLYLSSVCYDTIPRELIEAYGCAYITIANAVDSIESQCAVDPKFDKWIRSIENDIIQQRVDAHAKYAAGSNNAIAVQTGRLRRNG